MNGTTPLNAPLSAPALAAHPIHGLVAISNGQDYCLCGNFWPCRPDENRTPSAR